MPVITGAIMDKMTVEIVKPLVLSLVVTVILGPLIIPLLRRLKFGQNVRDDGPASHLSKTGTPTMGGVIFLAGITLAGVWYGYSSNEAMLVLLSILGFGCIGFIDDYIKIALKRPMGLRAREKLAGQIILSLIVGVLALSLTGRGTDLLVPFSGYLYPGGISLGLGYWGFLAFTVLVMVGTANAVNLTDGLDGLAAGVTVIVASASGLLSLLVEKSGVALMMAAVAGGCLGFLVYNRHPARVFMGDTGSLALGGALGAAAVITRSELLLFIIGGIYALETLSVIIQVFSFQVFHRRVFRMSPLHHHFELGNWSENRIVITFATATLLLSLLGLSGLKGLY